MNNSFIKYCRTTKWETNLKGREKKCIQKLSRRIESEVMILNEDRRVDRRIILQYILKNIWCIRGLDLSDSLCVILAGFFETTN